MLPLLTIIINKKQLNYEKKRYYTKMYDDVDTSDSYEWEHIDSCCGCYYEDADELIEDVIKEHGLQPKDAA